MISGSIQHKKGYAYAVLSVPTANGKHKAKWVAMGMKETASQRAKKKRLDEIRLEYSNIINLEAVETLFCDYITKWNEETKQDKQVTTYDGYVHMISKYIYPYFKKSKLTLQQIRPMDIEAYYKYLQRECGLSGSTALKHHQIIYTACKYAVYNRVLKDNPCQYVKRPKKEKSNHDFYTADELKELMQVVKGEDIETAIYLAVWFGLRRSEVLGLTWSNIDFEKHTISVCKKVVRAKQNGKLVSVESNKMKTDTSNRVLYMSHEVEEYLYTIKRQQLKYKLWCGNSYVDTDFVCVNKMGEPIKPDHLTDKFARVLKTNNLRHIRLHDLRHSCASYMLSKGFDLKDIQELLGHSNYNFTADTYTHVDTQTKHQMTNTITTELKACY